MSDPRPVCDSETMRAFEAEIERQARIKAEETKAAATETSPPDDLSDTTPFARRLKELGFDKI